MNRRLTWIAGFVALLLGLGVMPASAVTPFGPERVLVPAAGYDSGAEAHVTMTSDGTIRGVTRRNGDPDVRLVFFRQRGGGPAVVERMPYAGEVRAVAWDGVRATYILFQQGFSLKLGRVPPSTNLAVTGWCR